MRVGGSNGGSKLRNNCEKGKWRHTGNNFSEVVVKEVAETKCWHGNVAPQGAPARGPFNFFLPVHHQYKPTKS